LRLGAAREPRGDWSTIFAVDFGNGRAFSRAIRDDIIVRCLYRNESPASVGKDQRTQAIRTFPRAKH
jgi:hypothetical protein